ncbi:MAG: hypothetical protein CME67_06225 [Halobacteriovoraceae bacterium]|nr:hypothetical protein [Halobacteriovoraceae bacterium]|tara:strand:- start:1115 stop:1306 length:192 start_codon:yes stop_codon:yes gene_type:complete
MKSQQHNQGELTELTVNIESQLFEDLEKMSKNSGLPVDELVAIAVKRFRSSHADYMGIDLDYP